MTKKIKKKRPERTLTKLITDYDRDNELSPAYVATLRCTARRLDRHLGRPATTRDFKPKVINGWMKAERDAGRLSDQSRQNGKVGIVTLWKFSGEPFDAEKLRSIKVAQKNPEAWYPEELKKVIGAAKTVEGKFRSGIDRSLYLSTLWQFAYETGIRRRDILAFDMDTVVGGRAALTQNKTKKTHVIQLSEPLLADLRLIQSQLTQMGVENPSVVFRWHGAIRQIYHWFEKCRKIAGVDANVRNRAMQHMRRTGATEVDRRGGEAWKFLGHTARGLDSKSYIDAVKNARPTSPLKEESNEPINDDRTPPVPIDPERHDQDREPITSGSVAIDSIGESDPTRRNKRTVRFVVRRPRVSDRRGD
ncbi:MAG: hypothetical protein WBD31_02770 [Rubripirellula sp.]